MDGDRGAAPRPLPAAVRDFTVLTALTALTALTGVPVDLPTALFPRARPTGLAPPGRTSAGGSWRPLATADGWAAVSLARPDGTAAPHAEPALLGAAGADRASGARGTLTVVRVSARARARVRPC